MLMNLSDEHVVVVVVTYNSASLLPSFVDSLAAGLGPVSWELIVADNGSADDSVATVRQLVHSATVIELGRNAGYAAGINAAVGAAGSWTAVLALNPDVRLTPKCVPELLRA